jgi:ATP-dependent helicase/nuclease subunit A
VRAAVSDDTQLPLWGDEPAASPADRLPGPGGRVFTGEQTAAIRAREGGRLLYANAGSGKTAVIVERFVRAVLEDEIDPRRILAITFTEKAAGELRERLRERFLELGERGAARAAEGAHVSTIHGFCARLLRAHPFAAGIDPDFRVLDEAEGRRLRDDAFSAALSGFLDSAARTGPAALELAAAYRPDRLAKLIESAHTRLRSRGHTAPQLPPVAPRLVDPAARERLALAHRALADRLAGEPANDTVRKAQDALERCGALLGTDVHPMPAELDAACFRPGNVRALKLAETDEYLEAHAAYRAAVADALAAEAWPLLSQLLAEYGREYEARKRARSGLDFEDLELLARDLLREDASLRRAYSERFELLMVDEFQDTNPRQLEILELLDRDNLLTVGDEHQSIYGFRHADVALFRARREQLESSGRTASLAANFRARGPLLDVINQAFSREFGERFVPLADGREDARELPGPLVELLVVDERGWDGAELGELPPTRPHRHAEARALAARVARLVDEEGVRPGDIAVLTRALTDITVFEQALEEQGLATYVTGARGYWSAQQVRDLVAYLSALANPLDEVRMFQFLACPLGGVSSDGLAVLAQGRRQAGRDVWWALEQAFCGGDGTEGLTDALPEADAARLRELCPWFAAERAAAPRHALDELIDRAIVARNYDLHALSLRNGTRRYANVRKLLRLAREYETHEGRDLRGFLDWVARHEEADVPEPEAPVETEGMDAVRLMSIHAAKGLEFAVVCVADTGRQGPGSSDAPDLHVGEDGRVGLKVVSLDGKGVPALDWEPLQAEAQARADAEERRVFYVAVTRARERLIVSGTVPKVDAWPDARSNGPPLFWLGPALAPGIEAALAPEPGRWEAANGVLVSVVTPAGAPTSPTHPHPDGPVPMGTGPRAPEAPAPPGAPPLERPRPLPVATLSYSSLGLYARCPYRFYLQRSLRLPNAEPPLEARGDAEPFSGRLRGELTHRVLEELDFDHPRAPAAGEVVALAREIGQEIDDAHGAEVVALVEAFAASDLCRRLAQASDPKRETGFAFPLGDVVVNGVVDVMAREGDRVLVVDYKSDRLEPGEDLAAHTERDYRAQRLVYALAVLREGAAEVEVVHSFLERVGDPVTVTFTADQAADLEAELTSLAAGVLAGEFPVTETPHRQLCATCPGRRAMCSWEPEMTLRDPPEPR